MRIATLILVIAAAMAPLLIAELGYGAGPQDTKKPSEKERSSGEETKQDWVGAYLADQLHYNDEQIQEFKSNVAEMPRERLEGILRSLKVAAAANATQPRTGTSALNRNLERLQVAKANAQMRGRPKGPILKTGYQNRRSYTSWYHAPGNYGLFRGYSVWIWAQ